MEKKVSRRKFLKSASTSICTSGFGIISLSAIIPCKYPNQDEPSSCEDDGFVSLFDGKTLNGWHINGGRWIVKNGEIICEQDPPGSGKGGVLLSDKTYSDFELLIDVYPGWGNDSGVFLRSKPDGESYQVYVDYHDKPNDGGIVGFIYGQQTGGWRTEPYRFYGVFEDNDEDKKLLDLKLKDFTPYKGYDKHPLRYACTKEQWKSAWEIRAFNTLRIRCEGKYPIITTWINGVKICKFDAAGSQNPEFDKDKVFNQVGNQGHIALQAHGGSDWWKSKNRWKNIKIKEL